MNVLAIGAHPDDIEFLCAGTLALYARAGHQVTIAVATDGDVGSPSLGRAEIKDVRRKEQEASCAVIGADLIMIGFDDEWLFNDRESRTRFLDAIRQAEPDVMFVHSTSDYHPDHRAAGQIAIDCRIPATVRLVETALPAIERIPRILCMDTIGGIDFTPEQYVDISDTIDIKRQMLACHQSQDAWIRDVYGTSYVEMMETLSAHRGQALGVRFAEAYTEIKTFPYTPLASVLPPTGHGV